MKMPSVNYDVLSPAKFLARSAEVFPDQTAVVYDDKRYTYKEFQKALESGATLPDLVQLPIMEKLANMKLTEEKDLSLFNTYEQNLKDEVAGLVNK